MCGFGPPVYKYRVRQEIYMASLIGSTHLCSNVCQQNYTLHFAQTVNLIILYHMWFSTYNIEQLSLLFAKLIVNVSIYMLTCSKISFDEIVV